MIDKKDYKVYRKYEGDERKYSYNYDMIIERIMEIAESLGIEDGIKEYIDDLQQDYDDLEEEKEDLEKEIRYLKDILEE